jgi:SAM-dependent methyltransferase
MNVAHSRVTLLIPALLVPLACRSNQAEAPVPEATTTEAPVRDGLNDRFLADDLDVDEFVGIFEGESREIAVAREGILGALDLAPGMEVADIGAGTGLFEPLLARAVGPQGRVFAVDISPGFIEHLEERVASTGLSNVEPVLCNERSCNLPERSIDRAFVCDTYHHFTYPQSTLASLHAALRPGGMLVVVDFERIPGVSREWILGHVRAGKEEFRAEIEAAGFAFEDEVDIEGLSENYMLRFRRK